MNIELTDEQLKYLFEAIDLDGSNSIDIDELISFITNKHSNIAKQASLAILNVIFLEKKN